MKIKEFKRGGLVLAHEKKYASSMEEFLKENPLAIVKMNNIMKENGQSFIATKSLYKKNDGVLIFSPEELTAIK